MQTTSLLRSWESGTLASCLTPRNDTRRGSGRSLRRCGQLKNRSSSSTAEVRLAVSPPVLGLRAASQGGRGGEGGAVSGVHPGQAGVRKGRVPHKHPVLQSGAGQGGALQPHGRRDPALARARLPGPFTPPPLCYLPTVRLLGSTAAYLYAAVLYCGTRKPVMG